MSDESDFQAQVIEAAEVYLGWRVVHFRPARTKHGWRTPVSGSLGKGWPDLIMAKGDRLLAVELKGNDKAEMTEEQRDVMEVLRRAGVECYCWRPSQWPDVERVLGGGQ